MTERECEILELHNTATSDSNDTDDTANNSNDQDHEDERSTDTHSTTGAGNKSRSSTNENYLDRIQKETNRIRNKRRATRESSSNSTSREGSVVVVAEGTTTTTPTHKNTTDSSVADIIFDSSLVGPSSQRSPSSPLSKAAPNWNDIFDSSQRSNRTSLSQRSDRSLSFDTTNNHQEEKSVTVELKATTPAPVPRSNSHGYAEKLASSSEIYLDYQRGDSLVESNSEFFVEASSSRASTIRTSNTPERKSFPARLRLFSKNHDHRNSNTNTTTMDSTDAQKENEAFRKKLIDEVLGGGKESGEKVPMEKVMMIIWQFRDDKEVIKFMTRFVSKFAGYRDVFEGIEFYLPQLAHMIIHLETEWDDAILERFSLVIAQQSIHFALQLNWILTGAIEDYQPELPDGTSNPTYHPLFYVRCVKLLTNIERCVVYRKPQSQELQRLYEKGNITKAEMHSLEQADRRFTAMQITAGAPEADESDIFGGALMYKRAVRTSCFKFKRWKTRYFAIEERMLNCYNTEGGTLVRSMPLEGATVQAMKKNKYENMFRVTNRSFEFRMRASSPEERNKWIKMLEAESNTRRVFGHTDTSLALDDNEDAQRVIDELTPSQRDRYHFYRQERDFVRRLTDVAEDLRFLEPADRKIHAPDLMKKLEIPVYSYSPLMSSTDIFSRIHSSLWKDTRVFNTKARCPTVMYFLGVRGELEYKGERHANVDIAEYIHLKFDSNAEDRDAKVTTMIKDGQEVLEVKMNDEKETIVVKKSVSTIDEGDENKKSTGDLARLDPSTDKESSDPMLTPQKGNGNIADRSSLVWSGSFTENPLEPTPNKRVSTKGTPVRANRQLKKFLRESMVSVPRKLAHHLERKQGRNGSATNGGSMRSITSDVPIATRRSSLDSHGLGGGLYVGRSSVMDQNKILKGKLRAGDIGQESMNRAKEVVCGGETWAEKSFRMLEGVENKPEDEEVKLEIVCLLSKSNDDLRQEVFVMQMIHYYKSVFIAADLPLWLKTYKILSTSASTGLLEFNQDSTSLDGLKKSEHYPKEGGLRKYYENTYGGPESKSFNAAQRNFMQSLAGYSVVCYLLGLKDRHNGNIMIDMYGHLIHIDYGFCMGMCVGHEFTMERAPFKLTEEYVEVMDGIGSECYKEFVHLFVEGMKEARNKCQIALGLVEITMYKSNYPCFSGRRYGGGQALRGFRERLMLDIPDHMVERRAKLLIEQAREHWGTTAYDSFQQWSNGYAV